MKHWCGYAIYMVISYIFGMLPCVYVPTHEFWYVGSYVDHHMKRYLTKFIWHTYICFVFLRITNLKMIFMEKYLKNGIVVLSLFDGMSCGQIALKELGVKVDKYYASEIDKHAIKQTIELW